MKRIVLFIMLFSSFSLASSMQSFLDESINAAIENPGYYQSQTRGLYTLGSGKVRFNNNQSFSPFHVEAPRFSMGCGGIDATFGGFSYLNVDYLVEKLKAISAAAPAFAFQMALGVLCEDCKTTLNWLENIANQINNFNMDTCKASKRIGEFAADKLLTAIDSNMSSGQSNNFISATESAKSNQESTWSDYLNTVSYYMGGNTELAKEATKDAILQGSLIEEAIEKSSSLDVSILGTDSSGGNLFTSIVRAMIGDVVGYKSQLSGSQGNEAGSPNGTPKLTFITKQEIEFKSFLEGGKNIAYVYVKTNPNHKGMPTVIYGKKDFIGIKEIYKTRLGSILSAMKSKTAISENDRKFINSLPLPIAKYLNTQVLAAIDDIDSLVQYLAILETKAFIDFIITTTSQALSFKIMNSSDKQEPQDVENILMSISKNSINFKNATNAWFNESLKEWQQNKTINDYYIGLEQRMKSRLANSGVFNAYF
ncbi:conjugal transfer protein TraH [Arcobacter lanthieri]|uniref:conjugal transfer protein TraH n=1 Tax=Aliarcobacter lanthieri TaxID=1355374 RepID=UPI001923C02D|nr:conjugal transfer protein TraH [Aliarcobacter lanthieri]MBL3518867.1 conjugal transfer protein TraH [Aliarcobacter lanthieri]